MYTKEKGINDFYNYYTIKGEQKNLKNHDRKLYTSIIKDCNLLIRDKILENETIELPYTLGEISIVKFENKFDPIKQYKWKVDFKKSKELGYKVYYGSQYGYRWVWSKTNAKVKGKYYYHFKPVRMASRLIKQQITNGVDYFMKPLKFKKINND